MPLMHAVTALRHIAQPRDGVRALVRFGTRSPLRALGATNGVVLAAFTLLFVRLWRLLPVEGVKLHGNIDTGVDLFGPKRDLAWLPAILLLVLGGNALLAYWARRRGELLASWFLLGATLPVLLGALGAVVFLSFLNARP